MVTESYREAGEEFSDISYLADPARLAIIAVGKARYVRPTYYEDVITKELRIYDLDAGTADAMFESSISAAHSLKLKPQIEEIAHRIFPNERDIMERRTAKLQALLENRGTKVDQQG